MTNNVAEGEVDGFNTKISELESLINFQLIKFHHLEKKY